MHALPNSRKRFSGLTGGALASAPGLKSAGAHYLVFTSGQQLINLPAMKIYALILCLAVLQSAFAAEPLYPSLDGRVMCGYQGWFRTENDQNHAGWVHWVSRREGQYRPTVDYLPDVTEAAPEELCPLPLTFKAGATAKVFSSDNRDTVSRHFRWMKEYGIDGVFVQRFPTSFYRRNAEPSPFRASGDRVLGYCRDAAAANGRSYTLMFDLSGLGANAAEIVTTDWKHLNETGVILGAKDTAWQHHNGRPLISIWGVGFNDNRRYDLEACEKLVDFFKAEGCSVLLGLPFYWRTLGRDTMTDKRLHDVIRKADIVHSWSVGRFRDTAGVRHAEKEWVEDNAWCSANNLTFMPVVFPGFSWGNLKGEPNAIPRRGGAFLWEQFIAVQRAGVKCVYVAMFDEVDEGTQIFKTEIHPPQGEGFEFQSFGDLPSDHYLWLTGEATHQFRSGKPFPAEMPKR